MRRRTAKESLHGTQQGQLAIDVALQEAYSLTTRESAAAALLAAGLTLPRIADRLLISRSTAEKHLSSLRKKLGVKSTTEAAAAVARFSPEQARLAHRPSAPAPHESRLLSGRDEALARKLDEVADVGSAVAVLRAHLGPEGVQALYFVFLPMTAVSFRRGEVVESWDAPPGLIEAHHASGGFVANPISLRIFAEPDREILLDVAEEAGLAEAAIPKTLLAASRAEGLDLCLSFAGPFGCGFVGTAMFFGDEQRESLRADLPARISRLRPALMQTQSSLFARGVIARTAGLTVRERDSLTLIAQGLTIEKGALELGTSSRAFAQLLKNARTKLGALSNADAVARAMALNALTFL